MTKQAKVGIFAILALLLLFGLFFVITDFGTRHSGYKLGVHFKSAAGLPTGALVFFSGVTVGSVDSIQLLPDNTVDVILSVNKDVAIPKASKFIIQAPLTGSPSMVIIPPTPPNNPPGNGPTPVPAPLPTLAREVLPIADQPQGQNPATLADLLSEGQGEVKRLDSMLADLQRREPRLLSTLQSTMDNAQALTANANETVAGLSAQARQIADSLQSTIATSSQNINQLTGTLNSTVQRNSGQVDRLLSTLNKTSVSLNQSMDSLKGLATNPKLKKNVLDTTQNIADLTKTVGQLAGDLRTVTGNPQTQGQLRDTVANVDAASQKANSLLGTLGGTSHVPGVDPGATPYPVPPKGVGTPVPAPFPAGSAPAPGATSNPAKVKRGLGAIAKNLYAIQFRIGELSPQRVVGTNPLLTADRGPQTDVNLLLLPLGATSFMVGANDIGARTTYNFAALKTFRPGLRVGGGVLYSRAGILASYDAGRFGVEGRAYDLRRPTFDAYGNVNLTTWIKAFLGERDLTRPERRTVFGLQLQF